jgi:hypothetical protein
MRLRLSAILLFALVGTLSSGCNGITDPSQNTVESFAKTEVFLAGKVVEALKHHLATST